MAHKLYLAVAMASLVLLSGSQTSYSQIPGQFAQDFVAGEVPTQAEITKVEVELKAKPDDFRLTRKLAKGYFFQFFGNGMVAAVPKAQKTFERALELSKDDPESLAYLGSLYTLRGLRLDKAGTTDQKANFDRGFELLKQAERLGPRHGAVIAVTTASYLFLPDSYGMAPHVVEVLEGMRKAMGPMFAKFSHHGQQRLLLTLGQAYAKTGESEKARSCFEEALKVNQESVEAALIKVELARLK